jgi:hypothetical protein
VEAQYEIRKQVTLSNLSRPDLDDALSFLRQSATVGYFLAKYLLGQYMVTNHDEGSSVLIRDALARGYKPPSDS